MKVSRPVSIGRVFLTLSATMASAATAPGRAATGVIPVELREGRPIAQLRIGSNPPIRVIFDTGTTDNLIDLPYATRLGLPRLGPASVTDAATGRVLPGFATSIPEASLGEVRIRDTPVNAIDRDGRVAGVFGPNTFLGSLVLLELGKSRIRIVHRQAAPSPAATYPYGDDGADSLPNIPLRLAGLDLKTVVDTGSDTAILLPLALAARLPLKAPPRVSGKVQSAAGDQDVLSAVLNGTASIGSIALHDPTLEFIDRPGEVGDVGLPILRLITLVLDPAARRSWVLPR